MTKRIIAEEQGLKSHFKIRIVLPGALLHVASWSEPATSDGREFHADWINDAAYGDTIGFIDWTAVVAVTWRWAA